MAVSRVSLGVVALLLGLIFAISLPAAVQAQSSSPAPATAPAPTSDGATIDQGIAYALILLALLLTYLIHEPDFSSAF